jgi:putative ABC transport system permease protein
MFINSSYFYFARMLLQSYRHTKFSLVMLFSALLIATSGLSAVLVINHSAKQSYEQETTYLLPNVSHQIVAKNQHHALSKDDYAALKKLGFDELVAYATSKHPLYQGDKLVNQGRISLTGIDLVSAIPLPTFQQQMRNDKNAQQDNTLLALAFSPNVAFGHPSLISNLTQADSSPDAKFSIDSPAGKLLPTLQGIDEAGLGNDIVLDITSYFRLLPNGEISGLLWLGQSGRNNEARLQSLAAQLPAHLRLIAMASGDQQGELTKSFHLNLLAMALLMFVVCLFIVLNAVNLLLNARMPWLKISRQLGISRGAIFFIQGAELLLFNLLACAVGIVLGMYLANLVSPAVQATLESLYNVEVGFGQVSFLSLFMQVCSISLVGSVLALMLPFRQINLALNHTKTLAPNDNQHRRWQILLLCIASSLALFTLMILNFATQLWLLLMAVACLILCGCALLLLSYSSVLALICRLIPARLLLLKVSVKQSIALSSKSKIACCAFFIAATTNIGMNLMVDSFRGATLNWLDTRLAADYYLYYQGEQDLTDIAKQEGIVLSKRFENYIDYQGLTIQQYSYPNTETFKNAMVYYQVQDKEQAWQAFTASQGIFVNQQFAFHFNAALGDSITLPDPSTEVMTAYNIVGIVYDFGSPSKQVLLPIQAFDPARSASSVYALEGSEEQVQAFKKQLAILDIDMSNSLFKTADLLAMSMQTFDRTFLITDGLNVVTLLVAALSLACAIIVLSKDMKPQNMLLRSLGVSRLTSQLLALFQYLLLCIVALVFATPFGILLSWILINDINYHAFQWTYPLQINLFTLLQNYAVSLSVVLLIIFIPTFRASRKPLIEDIRWLN